MLDLLLELSDLIITLFIEVGFELGFELGSKSHEVKVSGRIIVRAGKVILLGALAGLLSYAVLPKRLLEPFPIPGVGLIIAPLIGGICMHVFGIWRSGAGNKITYLATFTGGALFMFAASLVRFVFLITAASY